MVKVLTDKDTNKASYPDLDAQEFRPETIEPSPADIYHCDVTHPTAEQLRRGRA